MSFSVNNIELQSISFNDQEVSNVYYNGTLVWGPTGNWSWGDETLYGSKAWWDDLKTWVVNATPEERLECVGKTKKLKVGDNLVLMRCIGADQDGEKTLTFQTAGAINNSSNTAYYLNFGTSARWDTSYARERCQAFYDACDAKSAIKPVLKGTAYSFATATYIEETVFLLSEREYGEPLDTCEGNFYTPSSGEHIYGDYDPEGTATNSECCYGYNEPYLYYQEEDYYDLKKKRNARLILPNGDLSTDINKNTGNYDYKDVWTRSSKRNSYSSELNYKVYIVGYGTNSTNTGQNNTAWYNRTNMNNAKFYIAPAFVIG